MTNKTLKRLVTFDIDNKTDVKILNSTYLLFSNQDFYKNGKPKGKPYNTTKYYFFDNDKDYNNFLEIHKDVPKGSSFIILGVDEGLRYDKAFLLANLNKI